MHKEKDYKFLSQYVYRVDEKAKDYDPNLKVGTISKRQRLSLQNH